jgi:hypothetical protein
MTKEKNRDCGGGCLINAQITKSDGMWVTFMNSVEDAEVSATSRPMLRLQAFRVYLNVAANEFWR